MTQHGKISRTNLRIPNASPFIAPLLDPLSRSMPESVRTTISKWLNRKRTSAPHDYGWSLPWSYEGRLSAARIPPALHAGQADCRFRPHRVASPRGFTLIELSIVLVIIGLIGGGILAGMNMMSAAKSRRLITQIEEYRSAVNVFRMKYGGLPGDLQNRKAIQFGFTPAVNGFRNGNRRLDTNANFTPAQCGETNLFWNDLGTSGLIKGSYVGTDTSYGAAACGVADASTILPKSAADSAVSIVAYSTVSDQQLYFLTYGNVKSIANYGWYVANPALGTFGQPLQALTAAEAFAIDSKMDDGLPLTGAVTAKSVTNNNSSTTLPPATPAAPAVGVCVSNAAGNPYNVQAGGNARACVLQFPAL